jgi:hypothetical protein
MRLRTPLAAIKLATALAMIILGGTVMASEEEFLSWSEVRIVGPERKDTGKVIFIAKTAGEKYGEVSIEAFGKTYTLDKEQRE